MTGLGHKISKQTPSLGIQPFHVRPFEVREWMEGEHTPETDLTKCHQDLEDGDRFESSDLRFKRCCFLAVLRGDTLVTNFVEGTEIAFSWMSLP